jgi:Pleckstrin homology domain
MPNQVIPVSAVVQGKITAQGKLLLQDTLLVMEHTSKAPRGEKQVLRERRVFLFEQIIIVSEEIDKRKNNMSSPGYIYKNSIKVCI